MNKQIVRFVHIFELKNRQPTTQQRAALSRVRVMILRNPTHGSG